MPTYTYACRACHHRFEVVQSMNDDALAACPQCEGALRRVFDPVGVAFRGSGFYRTDSRNSRSRSGRGSSGSGDTPAPTPTPASTATPALAVTSTKATTSESKR